MFIFLFYFFSSGLWVVGWRWPQHPKTPRPVAALQDLRQHPHFATGQGRCVRRGRFRRSPWKLHRSGTSEEAWPVSTGVFKNKPACSLCVQGWAILVPEGRYPACFTLLLCSKHTWFEWRGDHQQVYWNRSFNHWIKCL